MDEQLIHSMRRVNITDTTSTNQNATSQNQQQQPSPQTDEPAPPLGPSFEESLKSDQNWREPDRNLVSEMVSLLDQYFSDENLQKDKFLLKHVRRNRAGFVSVKLLTSFKKLKYLSKTDWRVTAWAIKHSDKLVLNHQGTKVRRKEPIPQIDLPTTSIKTLLIKLPEYEVELENGDFIILSVDPGNEIPPNSRLIEYGIEEVSQKMGGFGPMSSVKIVRPGKDLPQELRNHTTKHPELGFSTCAVIEFEKTEDCQLAYRILSRHIRAMKIQAEREAEERFEEDTLEQEIELEQNTVVDRNGNNDQDDEVSDDEEDGVKLKLQLPDSLGMEDLQGWQVSLLGSGRNPRRHAKKTGLNGPPGLLPQNSEYGQGDQNNNNTAQNVRSVPNYRQTMVQGGNNQYSPRNQSPIRHTSQVQPGQSYSSMAKNVNNNFNVQVQNPAVPGFNQNFNQTSPYQNRNINVPAPTSPLARGGAGGGMPINTTANNWQANNFYNQDPTRARNISGPEISNAQINAAAALLAASPNFQTLGTTPPVLIQNQQNPQVIAQTYQSDISDHFAMGSAPQHVVGSPDVSGLYASQIANRFTTAATNPSQILGTSPSMNEIAAASALLASSPPQQQQNINLAQNLNYANQFLLNQLSQQVISTQQNNVPTLSGSFSNQHLNIGNNQLGVSPSNFSPAAVNQQEVTLAGSPLIIQPQTIPTTNISNMPQNISSMQPRAIPINANQGISNLVGSPMGGSGFSLETPPAWFPGSLPNANLQIAQAHLQMAQAPILQNAQHRIGHNSGNSNNNNIPVANIQQQTGGMQQQFIQQNNTLNAMPQQHQQQQQQQHHQQNQQQQ